MARTLALFVCKCSRSQNEGLASVTEACGVLLSQGAVIRAIVVHFLSVRCVFAERYGLLSSGFFPCQAFNVI